MRVLLVSINRLTSPYPVYPLGLDYVAAAIGERHQVRLVDLVGSPDDTPLERALAAFDPELVGISLRNIDNTDSSDARGYLDELRRVVARVRACSSAPVVLGGAGFTLFPGAVMRTTGADYGVVGEGERAAALVDALAAGRSVAGLEGVLVGGGPDAEPPPPYAGDCRRRLPQPPERAAFYLQRGGMLNLQTKRGCPFRCCYCTYPLIEGRRLRRFAPERVAAEALQLQQLGGRYLFFADSVFNSDHGHAAAVARALRDAGVTIPWGAFFAPLRPPPDFYHTLAACGCSHVEFGTDTLSPRMLATYAKGFAVGDALAAHRDALAAGLHVAHYFMLGGPGESPATVDETLDAAAGLERAVCFFFCGIRIYPRTALWRTAVEQGQIDPAADLLDPVFYRPDDIALEAIVDRVQERGADRLDWVIGAGGEQTDRILERMYARGRTGPLWEFLIR